ncbi:MULTISPECIES: hypothetical protein [Pseudoalteromonas]|uniref:Intracellular septation protein A n=1 Tax=Pseudoalteromonas amylolytica TaxID=1859457 RepID=A0A1S1MN16_9GAMM|nr:MULTISPECIES: hypothetical protein [Pseudoalteromonas]OHU87032.1 hypothetical protein BET10_01115 [Pseudoalteromonas amylolytica]OHU90187.1 hypothetical protein BFC16_04660 [Pseudoalteromonas sp. JW3]
MKVSNLIFITIIALAVFYIQVANPDYVTYLYLTVLTFGVVFGVLKKDPNITHISAILALVAISEYVIFSYNIISLGGELDDYLVVGSLVFGVQLAINLIAVFLLICRVQLSKLISKTTSKNIELTAFDGIFHWFFIFAGIINLLALLENVLRNGFDFKYLTFIYDIYENLGYTIIALICGTLITMLVVSARDGRATH